MGTKLGKGKGVKKQKTNSCRVQCSQMKSNFDAYNLNVAT